MLRIVGDISLTDGYFNSGFGIGSKLKSNFDPFRDVEMNPEDCWIGNFEGVASELTDQKERAALCFRVEPDYLRHIRPFDFYGIANNHVMQHGETAYDRTVTFLNSLGSKCFGSNSQRTQIFVHQGKCVSITGLCLRIDNFTDNPSYWYNPEYKEIENELVKLPQEAFKIIYIHWGNEFINRPSSQQKRFAHWLIDSGFDLVVGMHPHVLQGYEVYNNKYIFYSIGNFVFDMPWEPTKYGVIVNVDLSAKNVTPYVDYIKISDEFRPRIVDENSVPKKYHFNYLNTILYKESNSEEYHNEIKCFYKQYRKANHRCIFMRMLKHPNIIYGLIKDYAIRRLIRKY